MLLNCGVGEDSWDSLGLQGDQTSHSWRKTVLSIHWKDWCWSWSSNTLATWWEELTHWKRHWCWERSKMGGEGDGRGWDSWMVSPTHWTWVWASSMSWWWMGKPGVLQSTGSQRVRHNWVTEHKVKVQLHSFILWYPFFPIPFVEFYYGFDELPDGWWCWASSHVLTGHLHIFFWECLLR